MIDLEIDEIENLCKYEIGVGTANPYSVSENPIHTILELITRLRQAEKLNYELKDRIAHIGLDVGIATTGQVPSEHPIKSRLEMVAKIAKDAARYRWLRDECKHGDWHAIGASDPCEWDLIVDGCIDEDMNGSNN